MWGFQKTANHAHRILSFRIMTSYNHTVHQESSLHCRFGVLNVWVWSRVTLMCGIQKTTNHAHRIISFRVWGDTSIRSIRKVLLIVCFVSRYKLPLRVLPQQCYLLPLLLCLIFIVYSSSLQALEGIIKGDNQVKHFVYCSIPLCFTLVMPPNLYIQHRRKLVHSSTALSTIKWRDRDGVNAPNALHTSFCLG